MLRHANTGIAFLELIVALFISTSLLLVGVPQSIEYFQNYRLVQSCNSVKELMQAMHLLAMNHLETVKLVNDPILELQLGESSLRQTELQPGVLFHSATNKIQCYKRGVCSPSHLSVKSNARICKVTLSLRGRVKTEVTNSPL